MRTIAIIVKRHTYHLALLFIVAAIATSCHSSLRAEDYPGLKGTGYVRQADYLKNLSRVRSIVLTEAELKELYPGLDRRIEESAEPSDPTKREPLEIAKRDGRYFWASNGNKPLVMHRQTITLSSRVGGRVQINDFGPKTLPQTAAFFVFVNPDGEGFIVVEHVEPIEIEWWIGHPCARGGWNYIEYRLADNGTLAPLWGHTDPFPYPEPDTCIEPSLPGAKKNQPPNFKVIKFSS